MSTLPGCPELRRVLVVDDEEVVLTGLRETLRLAGYEVLAFEDPWAALAAVRKTPVSVILTDHLMPGLTGMEFLAQAKAVQPDATRILITAVLDLSTALDAINTGEVYRFIVKPWLREELLVTVRNAVSRYELIRRNAELQAQTAAMNERLAVQLQQLNEQNRQLDRLNGVLRENLDRSVQLCLKLMETYSPLLGQQVRRAFALCQTMAEQLQLPVQERQVLEIASRLYDIGLVGVPREVLRKSQQSPDALSADERALIQLHPVLGQEVVVFAAELGAVGEVIRAHHERFDGTGYPDRLSGEQIPWLARLLAVAAAYVDSQSTEQEARDYVLTKRGTAFDPEAVRVFLRCLPQSSEPRNQRAVLLAELEPGMVLANGIYTSAGVLLVPEGQKLSPPHIEFLRNHHRLSPITQSLLVYC